MIERVQHKTIGVVVGLLLAVTVSGAMAEGFFSSYMHGVDTGFDSRTWEDDNTDSTNTWVYFEDCRYGGLTNGVHTDIRIRKEISWWPDETVGEANQNCYYSDIAYFGDMSAADYHFDIKYIMGVSNPANVLDVLYLDVGW